MYSRCSALVSLLVFSVAFAATPSPVPRPEHPRPDLLRTDWQTLNGQWEFEFDDQDRGVTERWYGTEKRFSKTITVPYCFQSKLSGIGDPSFHDVVWYRRSLDIPPAWKGRRIVLHFGAVDYEARVWVNGTEAARHSGGHVSFAADVTDYLGPGSNVVVLRVWDPSTDLSLPRGKQYWQPKSQGIWYTRTTGIWQPVWLEAVHATHISSLRITPDIDASGVGIIAVLSRPAKELRLRATARLENRIETQTEILCSSARPSLALRLENQRLWSPERPVLYDLQLELIEAGTVIDTVSSYFGQRKVSVLNDRVYLNNAPYYLRMVLDQGYWPQSLLTPPDDEAIQYDIKMTKAFGLNGARKHQKVEDPRWLYWADKMGLLVWGEMANAHRYDENYVRRFVDEWTEIVARDYNHPSIIAWIPINESWGVNQILTDKAQQEHARSMVSLIRSLDQSRFVVDNDGWEHTDATDLFTLHDYARTGEEMAAKYKGLETDRTHIPRNGREALVPGYRYNGTPFLMTEFGGIAFRIGTPGAGNEWGYSGIEKTREDMLSRLDGLVKALRTNRAIAGFCYTQITDVEQEINGLMTYDRKPKADPADLARIFGQ